ncbi:MAG: zf-HC2 domain-containing protein [Armatimonadetes bacterium]|nr:zf-HC2 domain-containing protein [Armatimonadota bacterium]
MMALAEFQCCKVSDKQLAAFYDGEISGWRARLLQAHVAVCARCQQRLEALSRLTWAVRSLPRLTPSPGFTEAVIEALSAREPLVLADMAGQLNAPSGRSGREFVEAVMDRVRWRGRRRTAQLAASSAKSRRAVAASATVGAVAMVAACLLLVCGRPNLALLPRAKAIVEVVALAAPWPEQIRAAAVGLVRVRLRGAVGTGIDVELQHIGLLGKPEFRELPGDSAGAPAGGSGLNSYCGKDGG